MVTIVEGRPDCPLEEGTANPKVDKVSYCANCWNSHRRNTAIDNGIATCPKCGTANVGIDNRGHVLHTADKVYTVCRQSKTEAEKLLSFKDGHMPFKRMDEDEVTAKSAMTSKTNDSTSPTRSKTQNRKDNWGKLYNYVQRQVHLVIKSMETETRHVTQVLSESGIPLYAD